MERNFYESPWKETSYESLSKNFYECPWNRTQTKVHGKKKRNFYESPWKKEFQHTIEYLCRNQIIIFIFF